MLDACWCEFSETLHWWIENARNMEHLYVTFVLIHLNCHNNDDRLMMSAVFILALLVCLCSAALMFLPALHSLSAGEYYPLFVLSGKHRALWLFMWSQSVFSWIFNEAVAFLFLLAQCITVAPALSLPDRNEVTKLKFEGKTFHVYANQREVRVWIVGNMCMF